MNSANFDPNGKFYALKEFRFNGRLYSAGSKFNPDCITMRKMFQLYDHRRIGYDWQVSPSKVSPEPLEKEEKISPEIKKPVEVSESKPKATKPTKATKKKAAKKKSSKES